TDIPSGKAESRFEEDNNGSPAISGRLAAQSRRLGEVGLSAYRGIYNTWRIEGEPVDEKRSVSIVALDFNTEVRNLELRGEAAWAWIDVPDGLSGLLAGRQWGLHLDAVLPIWHPRIQGLERPVLSAGLRLERIDLNQGSFEA